MALFAMTPYAWKTPKEGVDRLAGLDRLDTEIGFDIHVYK
jgi:23S rRNA (guanine745-N1)-methyltransferase